MTLLRGIGGGVWESNPTYRSSRYGTTVLKTAPVTGQDAPPQGQSSAKRGRILSLLKASENNPPSKHMIVYLGAAVSTHVGLNHLIQTARHSAIFGQQPGGGRLLVDAAVFDKHGNFAVLAAGADCVQHCGQLRGVPVHQAKLSRCCRLVVARCLRNCFQFHPKEL